MIKLLMEALWSAFSESIYAFSMSHLTDLVIVMWKKLSLEIFFFYISVFL